MANQGSTTNCPPQRKKNPYFEAIGKLGGEATSRKYGPEFYSIIGKEGARIKKEKQAERRRLSGLE